MIDMEVLEMIKKSDKTELSFSKKNYVVCANDLIKGKQSMSLQVARLIRLVVMQVAKEDKDLRTYTCRLQDLANFFNITSETLYRDVTKICEEAMKSLVYVRDVNNKKNWEMLHWFSYAKYQDGVLTIRLSNEIKDYVLELNSFFTRYQLSNILEFNSFYAIRLYEILMCESGINKYSNECFINLDDLRGQFGCEKKYTKSAFDFIRRTVDIAVKEINKSSDLTVSYTTVKQGRQISAIKFTVNKKNVLNKDQSEFFKEPVVEQLSFDDVAGLPVPPELGGGIVSELCALCEYEFSNEQILDLYNFALTFINEKAIAQYFQQKFIILKAYQRKKVVKDKFAYFFQMMQNDALKQTQKQPQQQQQQQRYKARYDIAAYESVSAADEEYNNSMYDERGSFKAAYDLAAYDRISVIDEE